MTTCGAPVRMSSPNQAAPSASATTRSVLAMTTAGTASSACVNRGQNPWWRKSTVHQATQSRFCSSVRPEQADVTLTLRLPQLSSVPARRTSPGPTDKTPAAKSADRRRSG